MDKDLQRVWDTIADSWTNLRVRPWEEVLEFSKDVNEGFVLDIGCGNCRNLVPFVANKIDCVGVDFSKGMIKEAEEYIKWGKNIVVKIPMCKEGMDAVRILSKKGIKTNVTLIFSPLQALIAAKSGATYVSPFIGRIDDVGGFGTDLVEQIRDIYDNYGYDTRIIAASIRHPTHVLDCALIGCDIATIPPDIMEKLFNHPLTDKGIKKFLDDSKAWKK